MARMSEVDRRVGGPEPRIEGPLSPEQLHEARNWYRMYCDAKNYKKYTIAYMEAAGFKQATVDIAERGKRNDFTTIGPLARILTNGGTLPEDTMQHFTKSLQDLLLECKKIAPPAEERERISVQAHIREKASDLIGELETHIDAFVLAGYRSEFNFASWAASNDVKRPILDRIGKYYGKLKAELERVLLGDTEGYENVGKREVKRFLEFVDTFVHTSASMSAEARANRKSPTRKKKMKTASQQVSKLSYLDKHEELGITSVDPLKIPGAAGVVLYSPALSRLVILFSDGPNGLVVKGSTVKGWSKVESFAARVGGRNLKNVLPSLQSGSIRATKSAIKGIDATKQDIKGRIKRGTLIVAVIK